MRREDMRATFEARAKSKDGGAYAIAWALMDLADSEEATARAIQRLGNADASTHFGAVENLSMSVLKAADALNGIGSAVGDVAFKMPSTSDD